MSNSNKQSVCPCKPCSPEKIKHENDLKKLAEQHRVTVDKIKIGYAGGVNFRRVIKTPKSARTARASKRINKKGGMFSNARKMLSNAANTCVQACCRTPKKASSQSTDKKESSTSLPYSMPPPNTSLPKKSYSDSRVSKVTNDKPSGSYDKKRPDIETIEYSNPEYKRYFNTYIAPQFKSYKVDFDPNGAAIVHRTDKDTHKFYDHGKLNLNFDNYNQHNITTDYFHNAIENFKNKNPNGQVYKYNYRPELPGNYIWQTIPTNHNTPFNIVPISGTGGRRVIKPTKATKAAKPTKPAKAAKPTKGAKPKKPKTIKVRKPTKTLKIKKSPLRKI
jgi:hypothetical protein